MALSIGIIGLPNVGKSTLFTALTRISGLAANYPFATIEPNVGIVKVPDKRLDKLVKLDNPKKVIHATIEFIDIAGLVEGASKGEGLGNKFLANIRETNAVLEVVRYFEDDNVVHVNGRIDPASDAENIKMELIFADLFTIEKALVRFEKEAKCNKAITPKIETVKKVQKGLDAGKRALLLDLSADEKEHLCDLHLLTMKPIMYIANVDEAHIADDLPEIDGCKPIPICASVESELLDLTEEERSEFLSELGIKESGVARVIKNAYALLGLQSFFTSGPDESRAWTIPKGAKAEQAAGVIHSDFKKGFIKAETASFDDYFSCRGEVGLRAAGKLRQEGKDYIVQDGDVMHFKFNV
ncbi:MAG: redox-regulated ATPase YchF [Eggerthellaceae bacterium]|nr:redox-regulated ATPase YchF [Eggerthellaceae bacterium]